MKTVEYARRHVKAYSEDDALVQNHQEEMDSYNCETFLQVGIDAFNWLLRADLTVRKAIYSGRCEYDPELDRTIHELAAIWLRPCEAAKSWAQALESNGHSITNLSEFLRCCEEAQAIVEAIEQPESEMPESLVELAEKALREHRDGKTAEFFWQPVEKVNGLHRRMDATSE